MLRGKTLQLEVNSPVEESITALKALASEPRWRILEYLTEGERSVNEVAQALGMRPSTAAAQIKILEEAKFLHTELLPAAHGLQKVCTRTYDNLCVQLPTAPASQGNSVEVVTPVGTYTHFEVSPTCGLASPDSLIGYLDDPLSFYEPERVQASLVWFRSGYLEYSFPNRLPQTATLSSLTLSMEICSEAPLHNDSWPSDITLWVNGCEVGTWTCPGDFGGRRGQLTPTWWPSGDTQYGVLKRWQINHQGAFIDGYKLSALTVPKLNVQARSPITVRLGVKPDALHVGGLNLFGRSFGNYPQDLSLRLEYLPGRDARRGMAREGG
jgi:predicted transcriptional regulator